MVFDDFVTQLESTAPGTDEAAELIKQMEALSKIVSASRAHDDAKINTLLGGMMSLLGIAGILTYEYTGHVITTKAIGFVSKIRQQ